MVPQSNVKHSPYGVPATSVADVLTLTDQPLAPFEQAQLKNLLNQVKAAPERVQTAFFKQLCTC